MYKVDIFGRSLLRKSDKWRHKMATGSQGTLRIAPAKLHALAAMSEILLRGGMRAPGNLDQGKAPLYAHTTCGGGCDGDCDSTCWSTSAQDRKDYSDSGCWECDGSCSGGCGGHCSNNCQGGCDSSCGGNCQGDGCHSSCAGSSSSGNDRRGFQESPTRTPAAAFVLKRGARPAERLRL